MTKVSSFYSVICLIIGVLLTNVPTVSAQYISGGVAGLDGTPGPKRPHAPAPQNKARKAAQTIGQRNIAPKGLLILANFTDLKFQDGNRAEDFNDLANGDNYTFNGATGSCKKYFEAQSNGTYSPQFEVVGPVELPHSFGYYGKDRGPGDYDRYSADFIMDAAAEADKLGVDFTQYDFNNDNVIDFVYVLYAGKDQAAGGPDSTIWAFNWEISSALYFGYTNQTTYYWRQNAQNKWESNFPYFDGKKLEYFACSSELNILGNRSGIGTICHEFSHVLGLPDYYVSEGNITNKEFTPGAWSLMGFGNYLNNGNTPCGYSVYDKYFMGWATPQVLSGSQQVSLPADGQTYYMITRDGNPPANEALTADTVYYLENRQYTGWDTYLPGHGLLVWRVVYNADDWNNNTPNETTPRYTLVTANGQSPFVKTHRAGEEMTFPGESGQYTELTLFGNKLSIQEKDGVITCRIGEMTTPVKELSADADMPNKTLENGRLVIRKADRRFDVLGRPLL